jgi:ATP sulfurylase
MMKTIEAHLSVTGLRGSIITGIAVPQHWTDTEIEAYLSEWANKQIQLTWTETKTPNLPPN